MNKTKKKARSPGLEPGSPTVEIEPTAPQYLRLQGTPSLDEYANHCTNFGVLTFHSLPLKYPTITLETFVGSFPYHQLKCTLIAFFLLI